MGYFYAIIKIEVKEVNKIILILILILILLIIFVLAILFYISKKVRLTLLNLLFFILNGIVLILQSRTFPYLFGYCKHCLSEPAERIDFSRTENALGTHFDANDVLLISSLILFIIALVSTYKLSNKWIGNIKRKKIYKIITTILFFIIFLFMQAATWA